MLYKFFFIWSPLVTLTAILAGLGYVIYGLLKSKHTKEGYSLIILIAFFMITVAVCMQHLTNPYDVYEVFLLIAFFVWIIGWCFLYFEWIYPRYIRPDEDKIKHHG